MLTNRYAYIIKLFWICVSGGLQWSVCLGHNWSIPTGSYWWWCGNHQVYQHL